MLYTMRKQVLVAFMSGFPNLISASLASQGHGYRVGWVAWVGWVDYCGSKSNLNTIKSRVIMRVTY